MLHDTEQKKVKVAQKDSNRIAFRAKEHELALLNSLRQAWQLPDISAVLHKILASYYGIAEQRAKEVSKAKELIRQWQIQDHELKEQ